MHESTNNLRDVVLFLGAGFSKDAGLPVMNEFWKGSNVDRTNLMRHVEKNDREAAQLLVESANVFETFRDYCRTAAVHQCTNYDDLEMLFCIAEVLEECGVLELRVGKLVDIRQSMELWTWKIYQQYALDSREELAKRGGRKGPYDGFVDLLKSSGACNRLSIITTNYDLLAEWLLWKSGNIAVYPFDTNEVDEVRVGSGPSNYIAFQDEVTNGRTPVPVCKLHGSVNYFRSAGKGSESKIAITRNLGDRCPIGKSKNFRGKPAIFAVDAIWDLRERYGRDLSPAIVPPTYAKLGREAWLQNTWKVAYNVLRKARAIVFIGYGLADSDGFMRAMFRAAMMGQKSRKRPIIWVIDPCKHVLARFESVFGCLHSNKPLPFEDAIDRGLVQEFLEMDM